MSASIAASAPSAFLFIYNLRAGRLRQKHSIAFFCEGVGFQNFFGLVELVGRQGDGVRYNSDFTIVSERGFDLRNSPVCLSMRIDSSAVST